MMKMNLRLAAAVFAGIMLGACQPQAPAASNTGAEPAAGKADPKVVEDVKALLAKHDKALNDQNLDDVMSTFSTDPKTVVLGTGAGEKFSGTDGIKAAYTEIFKDYEKGSLVTNCDWKTGGSDDAGKLAWLAATCQASDSMKGAKREYTLNVSAAVIKQAEGWRFIMLHMSNATAGGPPPEAKTAGSPAAEPKK